ncbi:MAG: hypothetical protein KDA49_05740 [Rhodospirillaceae bacterium]|nr:hypothetical protein [Rhodospirillaceae bacterium]MCA8931948.1 hypothetical protein [Rhodospirillaceae bacterium]
MKALALAAALAAALATATTTGAAAQAVIVMPNTDYTCAYVVENMEREIDVRYFMMNYTFGFMSGLNAQRQLNGQTVLDFGPIDNPMLITWAYQVCRDNPDYSYPQAVVRLFSVLLDQQQQQSSQ